MKLPQILIVGLFVSNIANAYDLERAKANMAQDLITCMTYYNYGAKVDHRDGTDPTNMETSARWALDLAEIYLPQMKRLDAMSELSVKLINKLVKEEGSERLVLNYADSCKAMLEHPTDRMQYWLDKK